MGIIPLDTEQIHSDGRKVELVESYSDTGNRFLCSDGVNIIATNDEFQLTSHFFSEHSATELVADINLLKKAPANGSGLRRDIQNRSMLALGW